MARRGEALRPAAAERQLGADDAARQPVPQDCAGSAPSPAMAKNVPRQPATVATSAPSGAPTATATVVPPTTTAMARAR